MAEPLVKILGFDQFPKLAQKMERAGEKTQQGVGHILIETGMNIHGSMKQIVMRGKAKGRVYEWEADLPGRKGDGGPLRIMPEFDRDLFDEIKDAGGTPALLMRDNSGGHVIPIKLRAKPHRASAPGDPPKSDTGMLQRKMDWEPKAFPAKKGDTLSVTVGVADLDYAVMLEEGTKFMKPRPFLAPAADKESKTMVKDMETLLQDID